MTEESAPGNGATSKRQDIQEQQYEYPYHYIPVANDGFQQTQHWSWGFRYLAGMEVVFNELAHLEFESLLDVGCGDGRFLREARTRWSNVELRGLDYSHHAIDLARAMNPDIRYDVGDITRGFKADTFDAVTCIETLEHIDPADVDRFVRGIANGTRPGGHLILTVPHINVPVSEKHYRHFDSRSLLVVLQPYFEKFRFTPFDAQSRMVEIASRALGGQGNIYLVTNKRILGWCWKKYLSRFLYPNQESKCRRIAVTCQRKST